MSVALWQCWHVPAVAGEIVDMYLHWLVNASCSAANSLCISRSVDITAASLSLPSPCEPVFTAAGPSSTVTSMGLCQRFTSQQNYKHKITSENMSMHFDQLPQKHVHALRSTTNRSVDKNRNLHNNVLPSVLWCCWLSGRKGIRPVKTEW